MANERYAEFMEENPKTWLQGLFEESSTQKHLLGTERKLSDGRTFIYCKMGAVAGVAGQVYQGVAPDIANHANMAANAAAVIGARKIEVTIGDTATVTANAYAEGYLHINTGAANGMAYKIKSHPAIAANGTGWFTLYDKLRSANISASTSKVTITKHPCSGVIVHPSPPTAKLVGVCTFPTTANYYVWLQKKGPCPVEAEVVTLVGQVVCASNAADGTVTAVPSAANAIDVFVMARFPVGRCIANNANDHWALIDLDL